ncbi:PEP-CTERM sorting domain-containing protein [Isosphaeraceae bacterium EP7]
MLSSWKRFAAKSLTLVAISVFASESEASNLVTSYDQWRTFPDQSITVPGDTPFQGLTFQSGNTSMAGKIPEFVPSPDDFPVFTGTRHPFTATDQGSFLMFVHFDRPEGGESSSEPLRVYLAIKGTFQGQLGGYSVDPRKDYPSIGGKYTGNVESVRVSGMTLDGQLRSAEITDPKQVVDPALIASVVEGTNIPASLVDAFLHLDRYSVKGDIGVKSTNFKRQLNLTLAATSPAPEPVPEPTTLLTFAALIGGLAYRRLRPHATPASA